MAEQKETKQERARRLSRERKRRQRERRTNMKMGGLRLTLAASQSMLIEGTAAARGFDTVSEYVYWLVRADADALAEGADSDPANDAVTRHVRGIVKRRDIPLPDLGSAGPKQAEQNRR